jgi:hypothetical protein
MSAILGSYVCTVLLEKRQPFHGINPGQWRWRRLTGSLFDTYWPELHYMRGPGPKWRQKHARNGRMAPHAHMCWQSNQKTDECGEQRMRRVKSSPAAA